MGRTSKISNVIIQAIRVLFVIGLAIFEVIIFSKEENQNIVFFYLDNGRSIALNAVSLNCLVATVAFVVCMILVCFKELISHVLGVVIMLINLGFAIFQVVWVKNTNFSMQILLSCSGIIGCLLLISFRHRTYRTAQKLKVQSTTDHLTGLLNRRSCDDALRQLYTDGKTFNLAFLDLDNFKLVNDEKGHDVGDALLKEVSSELITLSRTDAYRLGGDEFALINFDSFTNFEKELKSLRKSFIKNEFINSLNENVTMSIGSVMSSQAQNAKDLLKFADIAMYKAKTSGKNQLHIFSKVDFEMFQHQRDIELQIKKSLQNGYFYLDFQPQKDRHNNVRGFEALIRSREYKMSPSEMIPIAEESDLILEIDEYIIDEIIKSINKNRNLIKGKRTVSINVSAKHIVRQDFCESLHEKFKEARIDTKHIEIEIIETSLIKSFDRAARCIELLKSYGFHIALDDFGVGYSSLSYMCTLNFDIVKIDKVFVDNMLKDDHALRFIKSIIRIAHSNGSKVVVEGVEEKDQYEMLIKQHADFIQGFYTGKPMALELIF